MTPKREASRRFTLVKEGDDMKIGIIGSGRVGFSMGKYLCDHGECVVGYYDRHPERAKEAAQFTSTDNFETIEDLVAASDTLFITTTDGEIANVWDRIQQMSIENKIICHFSGSLSSDLFSNREEYGVSAASFHPMYAFSSKFTSYEQLNHVIFTAEGDSHALSIVGDIFRKAGNKVCVMESAKKTRYHASASMISNLMIGLYEMSIQMLMDCGFSREDAVELTTPLVQNNIKALLHSSPEEALTGPIERGDTETVKKHLSVLTEAEKEVYLRLGETVIDIARRKNPERDYQTMIQLLNDMCRNRRTQ